MVHNVSIFLYILNCIVLFFQYIRLYFYLRLYLTLSKEHFAS
jgi:hypothetical protein